MLLLVAILDRRCLSVVGETLLERLWHDVAQAITRSKSYTPAQIIDSNINLRVRMGVLHEAGIE